MWPRAPSNLKTALISRRSHDPPSKNLGIDSYAASEGEETDTLSDEEATLWTLHG